MRKQIKKSKERQKTILIKSYKPNKKGVGCVYKEKTIKFLTLAI